jgi:hypothetical protein
MQLANTNIRRLPFVLTGNASNYTWIYTSWDGKDVTSKRLGRIHKPNGPLLFDSARGRRCMAQDKRTTIIPAPYSLAQPRIAICNAPLWL